MFCGLNTEWRMTRYDPPSDGLSSHLDLPEFNLDQRCVSAWTLTIYLNDVAEIHGGYTDFSMARGFAVQRAQPIAGPALLLPHDVLHAGSPLAVTAPAPKYILRTAVLYTAVTCNRPLSDGIELNDLEHIEGYPGEPVRALHHFRAAEDIGD